MCGLQSIGEYGAKPVEYTALRVYYTAKKELIGKIDFSNMCVTGNFTQRTLGGMAAIMLFAGYPCAIVAMCNRWYN